MSKYTKYYPDPPAELIEELAKLCRCQGNHSVPCDGLLAGGPCDELGQDEYEESEEEEDQP